MMTPAEIAAFGKGYHVGVAAAQSSGPSVWRKGDPARLKSVRRPSGSAVAVPRPRGRPAAGRAAPMSTAASRPAAARRRRHCRLDTARLRSGMKPVIKSRRRPFLGRLAGYNLICVSVDTVQLSAFA